MKVEIFVSVLLTLVFIFAVNEGFSNLSNTTPVQRDSQCTTHNRQKRGVKRAVPRRHSKCMGRWSILGIVLLIVSITWLNLASFLVFFFSTACIKQSRCNDTYVVYFSYNAIKSRKLEKCNQSVLSPGAHMLAAAEAGVFTLVITNPMWVAKTRLCLQYDRYTKGA